MKHKLALLLVSIVIVIITLLAFKIYSIQAHKSKVADRAVSLRNIPLVDLDSINFSVENVRQNYSNYILIYFNSSCGHCDYQIKDLISNLDKFDKSLILLVSEERLEDIKRFRNDHNLFQRNILVGKMTSNNVYHHLGNVKTPSTFNFTSKAC